MKVGMQADTKVDWTQVLTLQKEKLYIQKCIHNTSPQGEILES